MARKPPPWAKKAPVKKKAPAKKPMPKPTHAQQQAAAAARIARLKKWKGRAVKAAQTAGQLESAREFAEKYRREPPGYGQPAASPPPQALRRSISARTMPLTKRQKQRRKTTIKRRKK